MVRLVWISLALWIAIPSSISLAQSDEFLVKAQMLKLREGPGTRYDVLRTLSQGETVTLLDKLPGGWWQVQYRDETGYVIGKYLARPGNRYAGWERMDLASGAEPECFNFSPEYDSDLDNYLKITVGSNTDAVIKLMRFSTDQCIRYVYVRSGEAFHVRNIPQGTYYLKIAYGRDWRQKVIQGQCYGKFMHSAQYEKGKQTLDFRIKETSDGYQIPYFELWLDVVSTHRADTFRSSNITETEFNR